MSVPVHWTARARANLRGIYDHIAQTSTLYASRVVDRVLARAVQLEDHPESGRAIPEWERRDLRELIEGPYRLLYQVRPDGVYILAVIHGRQELPRRG